MNFKVGKICVLWFPVTEITAHYFVFNLFYSKVLQPCNTCAHTHTMMLMHIFISKTNDKKSISVFIYSSLLRAKRASWQIPSKSGSQDNNCGAGRKGLFLPETCPLHSMELGPGGLKVTLYHWEKSLRPDGETNLQNLLPIPPASQLTCFIGILTIWVHGCCHGKVRLFQTSSPHTVGYSAHL